MILIAILISLGVERSVAKLAELRQFNWFIDLARWLRARLARIGSGALGVLIIVGLPVAGIALISYLLGELLGLLSFIFGVFVLVFSLGPKSLDDQIQAYIKAREMDDTEATHQIATGILHEQIPSSAFQLTRAVTESILVQANERTLAVLFWFAILGPLGAALYRLASILKNIYVNEREISDFARAATRLHATLDWLPARLTALGYAVSGSFVDAIANWRANASSLAGKWEGSSVVVLLASGLGALQLDAEHTQAIAESDVQTELAQVKSAQALVWRTLVAWLLVIALMTLAGWAG